MFQTFVEQPVFNLLEFIYAILPGHDLGVAIIIFTVLVRLALWPLVKRQLHQARAMRKLQPQLKKIKKEAGSDKQKLARLQMELYKEHGIKPFATIGTLIVQIPIFIALYQSINKLIKDPNTLLTFSYDWVRNLDWIQTLASDISKFEHTLLGLVDLSRTGMGNAGIYIPAIILALIASIVQYYQSKMMLPDSKDSKKLSDILKSAAAGNEAEQSDVSAAVSRSMLYFLPIFTFMFGLVIPAALTLYLLTSALVGCLQQYYVLNQDKEELEEISEEKDEIKVTKKVANTSKNKKSKKSSTRKKRRK